MALNQNIGFIQVGQKAELKLDTFPFQKYGTIETELTDSGDGRVFFINRDELDTVDPEQAGRCSDYTVPLLATLIITNGK